MLLVRVEESLCALAEKYLMHPSIVSRYYMYSIVLPYASSLVWSSIYLSYVNVIGLGTNLH